jgi:hypothetical protein
MLTWKTKEKVRVVILSNQNNDDVFPFEYKCFGFE